MAAIPPLAAEKVFQIGSFPVTNSMVNAFIALVIFAVFAFFINKGVKKYYSKEQAPKGVLNFFESILEFLLGYADNVTKDRKKTLKILPLVGTFFLFILVSNWMGLLPGTGSIGRCFDEHSKTFVSYQLCKTGSPEYEILPLFRPANTDLNMTLAMAVFGVLASHFLGIIVIGFFKYANRFIKLGDLYKAFVSLKPVNILTAVIEFFVGLIEVFSEVAKMVSLSLRLFGNIFAGEVLLTVLASLIAFVVPLPFMGLELLVGFIQAVVFSMLLLVYITMAITDTHGHAEAGHGETKAHAEEDQVPAV